MTTKDWKTLATSEQRTLLEHNTDEELVDKFNQDVLFYSDIRKFFSEIPSQTIQAVPKPHFPPKELIITARRDLSFFEANFELFDNSIDKWRTLGMKNSLNIELAYDINHSIGRYRDNAGGMNENEVYKVFIPGETTNNDFSKPVIGSFGMGAKKGIFRLTDGAKVVSCTSDEFSATSEVPEKWEQTPSWETLDGRAEPIGFGCTEIYLYKLFDPPSQSDIDELIKKASQVYGPLLKGDDETPKINISVNGVPVTSPRSINWSGAESARPRIYDYTHTFRNFLDTGRNVQLNVRFVCGLTQKSTGRALDKESDWGIDVYGNGRLIEPHLKDVFGFGTSGLGKNSPGVKYFRGLLFITGHSIGIPWDTHKRQYLQDHIVSAWLKQHLRKIIKSYYNISSRFASDTTKRKDILEGSVFEGSPDVYKISPGGGISDDMLPKWIYGKTSTSNKTTNSPPSQNETDDKNTGDDSDESNAVLGETDDTSLVVEIPFAQSDFSKQLERFSAADDEELATAISDCLISGIAFQLSKKELDSALSAFHLEDPIELSDLLKEQLIKKIGQ